MLYGFLRSLDFIVLGKSFCFSSSEFAANFCWGEIGTLIFVVNRFSMDEHGSVHAGNPSVLDEGCTKIWSDPVRFAPS
jgi:hypothetical protein